MHMVDHVKQQRDGGRPRRPYRLGRRQPAVDQMRERITAATFELHATVGPSRTTIRAIADRAGVQRHTVYHHFPDLETLYQACTEHGIRVTGMPTAAGWSAIDDPAARLRHALTEMFAWYRANERMLNNVMSDFDPTAPPPSIPDPFEIRMGELLDALGADWATDDPPPAVLGAVLAHAVAFETWRSLTGGGLTDAGAIDILVALAVGVADGSIPP